MTDRLLQKLNQIQWPQHFTAEQKACAQNILGKWKYCSSPKHQPGFAYGCPQIDSYLGEGARRKELLKFLVDQEVIAAYSFGRFYIIKLRPSDTVPEGVISPGAWIDKAKREQVIRFQTANRIQLSFWNEEFLQQKFPSEE